VLSSAGKTINVYVQIAAFDTTNNNSAVYNVMGGFKNVSGTVTQLGTTSIINSEEENIAFNVDFSISGTTVNAVVTGVAAHTINWKGVAQVVITQ
jgi:hypothetical protein